MSDPRFETALVRHVAPDGLLVSLREIQGRGMIDLRGFTSDRKFMTAAKVAFGVDLPKAPRSSAAWGDIRILWLSIDQWLVIAPHAKVRDLIAGFEKAANGVHGFAVDVSDMRSVIRIEGEDARVALMKGTSLDLLGQEFPEGTVKRLRFAEIAALLHAVERDVFDLYVFRSYAHHAWDFLARAARKEARVTVFGTRSA
ncbi:MAG: sarcosine oxidase subunit gamma [Aestuariivirga sp.]